MHDERTGTEWRRCGCFEASDLEVKWLCPVHRGISEARRLQLHHEEQERERIEADAWLKWTGRR